MKRARGAFTLVEIMVAMLLSALLLGGVFSMLSGGNQLFTRGLAVANGRQAALLFFEQLEDDVAACMVVPGHSGDPVAIGPRGASVAFYRTNRRASTMQVTVCSPVEWALSGEPGAGKTLQPVRNGMKLRTVAISDIKFELYAPDAKKRQAWILAVRARFPEGGILGRDVTVSRMLELVQPTSLARYGGGSFTDDVTPLSFVFLEAPDRTKKLLKTAGLESGAGPLPPPSEEPTPATSTTTSTTASTTTTTATAKTSGEPL